MGSRLESNSNAVRRRIEGHTFDNEEGDEYEGSTFGGFPEYFRRKKIKLQNLDAELRTKTKDNPPVFRGVVAHVNGYTQPSLNDLHHLIVSYGGGFMQYLDGKTTVTHIIASNLTPKKAVEFKKYRVVKPAWVVDSVKAGRLLPWDSYRVLDEGAGQRVLGFDHGKVVSQVSKQTRGYRDQTDASWYTDQLAANDDVSLSASRSRFLSQKLPTPGPASNDIDDLPAPGSAPQRDGIVEDDLELPVADESFDRITLDTPPQTSPPTDPKDDPMQSIEQVANELATIPAIETPTSIRKRLASERLESHAKRAQLTAEEHNAILLSDPNVRKSTVVDPGFLEQYYRESRLHHLSTWKADLKSQMQALAAEKTSSQKARMRRIPGSRRYILHVDFDSFFAAVSIKKNAQYKDKPAVVAHGNGSGSEIASCNYPARKFGVKNGMWMKRALELCPDLKILPYDFPAYEEASRAFYEAIIRTGGIVQSVSIDEALVDISTICAAVGGSNNGRPSEGSEYREQEKAADIALSIRNDTREKTGCEVSVGIGANILQAKVALRKAKPAGQFHLKPEEVLDFIGKLEVQSLPGVAWSLGGKLEEIGIKFVADIRQVTKERLTNTLGPKTGEKLWDYSRGIDRSEVGDAVVRKSVSAEVNWGVRFVTQDQVDEFIENLCGELQKRLQKERVKGRQFTMKIMRRHPDAPLDPPKHLGHGQCETHNKSVALGVSTSDKRIFAREALSVLKGFGFSPGELRGIGVQVTKLDSLKPGVDGQGEGSQRRLQFKTHAEPPKSADKRPLPSKQDEDPIQDDVVTPKKPRANSEQISLGAPALNESTPRKKPLNILGTQFVMPTQVDPKVLAELPADIRARLARHMRASSPTPFADGKPKAKPPPASTFLPNESQLDPEALNALPEDLRAEVLGHYNQDFAKSRSREQSLLPQSPRKNRTIPPPKRPIAPIVRRRGRPPKYAIPLPPPATTAFNSTLTQSNFVTNRPSSRGGDEFRPANEPIDANFLAALPDDIRSEILAEQRRDRLSVRSALTIPQPRKPKPAPSLPTLPLTQQTLKLPPRSSRPTFTTQYLHEPDKLREAISAWWDAFADEGPYREDVGALEKYIARVVGEERDMGKAVEVVKWLEWVVEEGLTEARDEEKQSQRKGLGKWEDAVVLVKQALRTAVRERGLGEVDL